MCFGVSCFFGRAAGEPRLPLGLPLRSWDVFFSHPNKGFLKLLDWFGVFFQPPGFCFAPDFGVAPGFQFSLIFRRFLEAIGNVRISRCLNTRTHRCTLRVCMYICIRTVCVYMHVYTFNICICICAYIHVDICMSLLQNMLHVVFQSVTTRVRRAAARGSSPAAAARHPKFGIPVCGFAQL